VSPVAPRPPSEQATATATATATADRIRAALAEHADPVRAAGGKAYLHSDLEHLGVPVPAVRRIVREALKRDGADHDRILALAELLWQLPVHEHRLAATLVLDAGADRLRVADLPLIERLVVESGTWALVDVLAPKVAGRMLVREPAAVRVYARWITDERQWLRRAGILAFLPALSDAGTAEVYLPVFLDLVEPVLSDRRFFVRKAIGWVLRQAGRLRPAEVSGWLAGRIDRVSGVTIRETVKYLGESRRDELLTAYRARG
jgi:3-methyladenine DNA glycosylase AlkD